GADLAVANYVTSSTSVLINAADWHFPLVGISDVSVSEGNSGTRAATFSVDLSAPSDVNVTVNYTTANGTATAPSDFAAASGTLTFLAGETSKQVTVNVNGDRLPEPNETFFVKLSSATSAVIADDQGVGTIVDDEPLMSISDVSVSERNTGTRAATFSVNLSAAYDANVTVIYATANGTAAAP